jgi:uncharacterized short protein YbdD (DUF466 family)
MSKAIRKLKFKKYLADTQKTPEDSTKDTTEFQREERQRRCRKKRF